jgi:DNA-binding protein HU-beta
MGKQDLVEALAKRANLSKNQAGECLNAVLAEITSSLKKGNDVTVTGFGTFSVSKRKARQGVNPRTGEKIKIAATKVPKFKAGKALKEAVK